MPTLDTSFLIDLIRHDPEAMRTLKAMEREGLPLATTAINALELYRGAFLSTSVQENLREVEAITRALIELPITEETYRIFGTLAAELQARGSRIGDFDEVIAAITLAGDGEIVTRDSHFTRVPGLKVRTYEG
ncbi:type II toxin-antitoxin system VapC family toxin [Methanoculleus sp. Afa-1]|uniref:Ribonuclease VapC n=1 Tax=Methanoculleus formosensis TaxID=2590886 RepID=A0A9E5DCQ5_9EURY|nr:type II toxin-antitoxin system VapC family toxin [Methanoculleus sp. Afa-1]MCT8337377.1 type II toxin-antitoxin system VapC family toxin [Methanoculleus sp. Afa-1]